MSQDYHHAMLEAGDEFVSLPGLEETPQGTTTEEIKVDKPAAPKE